MADFVGAIDSGTTSTRFMLFNRAGSVVGYEQQEHKQIFPRSGWVEHDPLEIWDCTCNVIERTLSATGIVADDIASIGITNQRETAVLWDKRTGVPVYNAVVWQDTRTDRICRQLKEDGFADVVYNKAGLPLATYFSGPKIRWILENVQDAQELVESDNLLFGTVDSWLIWKLTGGEHITDVTNASRTMLMNLDTLDWDNELLQMLEVPRSILPEIRPSSDPRFYGMTRRDGPFKGAIPICGDLGDQQAATVGQTCFEVGEAKNTYGTGCFLLLNTGEEKVQSSNGLITTVAYQIGEHSPVYALEGSIAMAGATVQWLRDDLEMIDSAVESESLAESVPDNGGCYLVPAFSGLFAPYWRSDARGVIVGLTQYVKRAHIVRAALESICYQTREVLEAMEADSGYSLQNLKVDGGATANKFLMQFQADILGTDVLRPQITETTSLGAAYAAGIAVGFWKDLDSLRSNWQVADVWQASMDEETRTTQYTGWKRAVERTFNWVEDR